MWKRFLGGLLAVLLVAVYGYFDPSNAVFFPKCPFRYLTGFQCPGCGSQRAVHALLHADLAGAFAFNPLLVIAIPYLVLGYLFEAPIIYRRYPVWRKRLFGPIAIWIWFVLVILYSIARNIWPISIA